MNALPGKLVVVDDDEGKRYVTARVLRAAGYEVLEAGTVEATMALLSPEVDLIVLDLRLPDGNGLDVSRRLKADPATTAILILQLSATYVERDDRVRGLESGADAYLTHPIGPPELVATVRSLMRLRIAERERSALLARVEASERRYRGLANLIPQIVFTARDGEPPDWVNGRWAEYTGRPARWTEEIVHPDDREPLRQAWNVAFRDGAPLQLECRLLGAGGQHHWHLARAVRDPATADRWFGTFTDVEEQRQRAAELEQNSRFREQLVGIVSHDLRNPLQTIALGAQYLLSADRATPEQTARTAGRISAAGRRMQQIIDLLLDYTGFRIGGGIRLERRPVDLGQVVRQIVEEVELLHPDRSLRVSIEDGVQGALDAPRVGQLVANLVTNAIQHGDPDRPVRVHVGRRDGHAVVRTHNQGPSIPDDLREAIFEPFRRGEAGPNHRPGGNLGLGLFIAREIARAHGGDIELESDPQQGTTFTARLPL